MPNFFLRTACVIACAYATLGCNTAKSELPNEPGEPESGALQVYFTPRANISSLELIISRVTCVGEPVAPQVIEETITTIDANVVDAFVYLEPGCYDILAIPRAANGLPSASCDAVTNDGVIIVGGHTTEESLILNCENPEQGVLDVYVRTGASAPRAKLEVKRVSCAGEPFAAVEFVKTTAPSLADSLAVNEAFLVPPGCYEVVASPLDAIGTAVADCPSTQQTSIVFDGWTTEVGTEFVCK